MGAGGSFAVVGGGGISIVGAGGSVAVVGGGGGGGGSIRGVGLGGSVIKLLVATGRNTILDLDRRLGLPVTVKSYC